MTTTKEIRKTLVKCQNDITTYMIPGGKPEEKKRAKEDISTQVHFLLSLIPALPENDRGLRKELHQLQKSHKQFVDSPTDENLAALQNELDRMQEFLDRIDRGDLLSTRGNKTYPN